jgi:protein-disulfide isomerase
MLKLPNLIHHELKGSPNSKTIMSFVMSSYLVIIITMVIAFFLFSYTISSQYVYATTQQQQKQQKQEINNLSLSALIRKGSPYLGNISAPVTIIDFSDFQCGLCARYVKATEPLINQTYVQTEKAALVFKHLPNRGFDSMGAALAAQCTNDQGKFWEYHELLFHSQQTIDSGWVSKDNLKKFASQIPSMDMKQFEECLNSEKYKSFIEDDLELASSFNFQDTPSFVIVFSKDGSDPEILKGAHPFPSFKAIVDKKLSEVQNNK